jgi:hypothetical protein
MKIPKNLFACTLIALFLSLNASAQTPKKKDELDQRVYNITLVKDNTKKPRPKEDLLSFKGGKLKSDFVTEEGFPSGPYDIEVDSTSGPRTVTFIAEIKLDKEVFTWEGKIVGEAIEGTCNISKKGEIKESYTFTGTQKNKKKPATK